MAGRLHPVLQFAWSAYAILFGGTVAVSALVKLFNAVGEDKKKKFAPRCEICRGKGFYSCQLCKGVSTIKWSPLHDPIAINPCVCPTCDGNRVRQPSHAPIEDPSCESTSQTSVQRCLNCISKGHI